VDVEGSEWVGFVEDLGRVLENGVMVHEVLMELHLDLGSRGIYKCDQFFAGMQKLGYHIYHQEHNVYCNNCFEYAWVHTSFPSPLHLL
jgi:Methyltransferase domain